MVAEDELQQVHSRRYREARAAGMEKLDARIFAMSRVDVGDLRRLVKFQCPAGKIARILN